MKNVIVATQTSTGIVSRIRRAMNLNMRRALLLYGAGWLGGRGKITAAAPGQVASASPPDTDDRKRPSHDRFVSFATAAAATRRECERPSPLSTKCLCSPRQT